MYLQERINRVINNHQYNCQHPGNYLFVLKGFEYVLKTHTVPVNHIDVDAIHHRDNLYITFEEAHNLSNEIVDLLKEYHYHIWLVDFNLFKEGHMSSDGTFVEYPDVSWINEKNSISVFNTINPLIGLVSNPSEDINRFDLYHELSERV